MPRQRQNKPEISDGWYRQKWHNDNDLTALCRVFHKRKRGWPYAAYIDGKSRKVTGFGGSDRIINVSALEPLTQDQLQHYRHIAEQALSLLRKYGCLETLAQSE